MIRSIINSALPLKKNGQLFFTRTISQKPQRTDSNIKGEHSKQPQRTWQPTKRVSRVTMEKIRSLAALHPGHYNTVTLATEFRISPEAVKRILKSKFRPEASTADRQEKNRYAAMGVRKQQIQSKVITFPQTTPTITAPTSDRGSYPTTRKPLNKPHHSPSTGKKDQGVL